MGEGAARKAGEDAGEKKGFQFAATPERRRAGRAQCERTPLHVLTGRARHVKLDCHCSKLTLILAVTRKKGLRKIDPAYRILNAQEM